MKRVVQYTYMIYVSYMCTYRYRDIGYRV